MQPDYSISTPENVDLHLELAGIGNRVLACLIDTIISWAMMAAVTALLWGGVALSNLINLADNAKSITVAILTMCTILLLFAITFGYYIFFEGTWQGQTPGKKIVGIRVIELSGNPVGWVGSALRNLFRTFDIGLACIGLLPMIIDARERRFGDMAAGTIVIRERAPELMKNEVLIANSYSEDSLDIGRISPQEYDLLVSFLKRRQGMDRSQRPLVAQRLAKYLKEKLNTDLHEAPETFIERIYCAYKAQSLKQSQRLFIGTYLRLDGPV